MEESLLLIDLYLKTKDVSSQIKEPLIMNFSLFLNKRATLLGYETDEKFRNIAGIKLQLQNITYLITNGQKGLPCSTKMFVEAVKLYNCDKAAFQSSLSGVFDKYNLNQDYITLDKENMFSKWLRTDKGFSPVVSDETCKTINKISSYVRKTNKINKELNSIVSNEEIDVVILKLSKDKIFTIQDRINKGNYLRALHLFQEYIRTTKLIETTDEIQGRSADEYVINEHVLTEGNLNERVSGKTVSLMNENENYIKILTNYFPKGFKLSSPIDAKKFQMFYASEFEYEIEHDEKYISNLLLEHAIEYDSGRVMSPENAIDKETLNLILSFIEDTFANGKTAIHYDALYNQFEEQLSKTNVYNPRTLKHVLAHFTRDKYYFKRSYFISDINADIDLSVEIKNLLIKNTIPMCLDDICTELPHIPSEKIKSILGSQPEFLNTARKHYTHIDCVYLSDNDLSLVSLIIDEALIEKEYIVSVDLIDALRNKFGNIIEKNAFLSDMGFRNAIAYALRDKYDFYNNIISANGKKITPTMIFNNYCVDKNSIRISDLSRVANELGFSSIPGVYLEDIYKDWIRINDTMLLRKGTINFDVEAIDAAIDKFCSGDYISILQINSFSIFPSVDIEWNSFLLESYAKWYSGAYKSMGSSYSVNKCIGAIVKKTSLFSDYDQILSDVIANEAEVNLGDNNDVLNFLYDSGFIAKRRMSSIDQITSRAKVIRSQKGNL